MVEAWRLNMVENFVSGYVNCLDESMSVWTNKFTCPGFMFVPCKPWLFGNEYHMVCCCTSGIMWGIDLVEGKDCPRPLGQQEFDNMGSTVGLLLRMLAPIFHKGDRIPSTTPGAEPPRDARDSGSAWSPQTCCLQKDKILF